MPKSTKEIKKAVSNVEDSVQELRFFIEHAPKDAQQFIDIYQKQLKWASEGLEKYPNDEIFLKQQADAEIELAKARAFKQAIDKQATSFRESVKQIRDGMKTGYL